MNDTSAAGSIVVAIKPGARAHALVQEAARIAATDPRHGAKRSLSLVHVTPQSHHSLGGWMHDMVELAAEHASVGVKTHSVLLNGSYPQALMAHAAQTKAVLVLAGGDSGTGTKTANHSRLLATAQVPLLLVPPELPWRQTARQTVRILLADDLANASLPAIQAATTLVALLGLRAEVWHVHVANETSAAGDGHWPGLSTEDRLLDDHEEHVRHRLTRRARQLRHQLEVKGGAYANELWRGRVRDEINRAAQIHAADICVFGSHRMFRRDAFALGNMSYASMLGVGRAVVVAPFTPSDVGFLN